MAALRGTLHVRAAELTAAHGEAAVSAAAPQAAAEELGVLRAELEKVLHAMLLKRDCPAQGHAAEQPALVKRRRALLPTASTL